MDKNKLKTFAIESRRQLIKDTTYQANLLGITKDGIHNPIEEAEGMQAFDIGRSKPYTIYDEDIEKRANLVNEIQEKGFKNVIEEVAYTWFNRIIAVRYMEVNNYLPTKVRVLSSEIQGKTEPDIMDETLNKNLNFNNEDIQYIYNLKEENKNDELFQFLFIKQCNELNELLPELFEKTQDYSELLLNITYTNPEGIIYKLINNIPEKDFKNQVEIIGWMYQYYNTEINNLVYNGSYKKEKINKHLLPAATQLFTPDWPVKYMVENSLGKLWLNNNPNNILKKKWKYYIENDKPKGMLKISKPEEIKIFDPCMGSGHILIYVFDVLMQIYLSQGYRKQDAVLFILENNIFGLDIDYRAYQLAYFSILMKACEYDYNILKKYPNIHLSSIMDSSNFSKEFCYNNFSENKEDLNYIFDSFLNAKELGSIVNIKHLDFQKIKDNINYLKKDSINLYSSIHYKNLFNLINQAEILSNKYDIVITNPPYLNSKRFGNILSNYAKKNYFEVKADFATIFYEKAINDFCKKGGYISFITIKSWMYLKTFEKFRKNVINDIQFDSIIDFGTELFEGKIGHNPITAWVNVNVKPEYNLIAIKLSEYNYSRKEEKEQQFFNNNNKFIINQKEFHKIPGSPIAYWANNNLINSFNNGKELQMIADINQGLATTDNNQFLRLWYEVDKNNMELNCNSSIESSISGLKWFPYNKGGNYRKWYGNQEFLINWKNDGFELKNFKGSQLKNRDKYFCKSLSWSKVSSGNIAFRFYPPGFLFDVAGCSVFLNDENDCNLNYIFGFLNSNVAKKILDLISPTLNYEVGHVSSLPIIYDESFFKEVNSLVKNNIELCKKDWDDYETSWNFISHPLIKFKDNNLEKSFIKWSKYKNEQFDLLKYNEIKLNKIFSEIYSIPVEFSVENKHISVTESNYKFDIKSLISFSIGCIFGRFSLDEEGLVFAGGDFDLGVYSSFVPDDDNIVPVLDSEYFDDDVVGRFVEFVKVCFGEESLEENLDFIAGALKNKGKTSREVIRSYFLNDFFKDHVKMYKKCPIYWLFDSGKEDGFKCLVYMHRYSPDLVARVRTGYLHKTQKAIESQISYQQNIKENSGNSKDQARADKRIKKLTKQLDETRRYDEALAHVASQNIEIDLDDGVKVNYAKFQNVEVSKEGQKVKKINLLKKI